MLQGMLTGGAGLDTTTWLPRLWDIGHPSYYGMMIASATKVQHGNSLLKDSQQAEGYEL